MGLQFVFLRIADCQTTQQKKILFQPEEAIWEWRVFDLVDWQNHHWDKERITAMFHQFNVEAIFQIPLSRRVV